MQLTMFVRHRAITNWAIFPIMPFSMVSFRFCTYSFTAMGSANNKKLLRVLLNLFLPIARIFLRNGLGHRELHELAKTALVQVATEEYGLRGRPTNASRVAAMTGLTRREVRRLKNKIARGDHCVLGAQTPIFDVLDCWRSERDFQDALGQPLDLPLRGERRSFSALVRSICRDLPPGALRVELKRIGAIAELDNGKLRLLPPSTGAAHDEPSIDELQESARPMLAAIAKNSQAGEGDYRCPVKSVTLPDIAAADLERFRAIASKAFDNVLEDLRRLLSAYRTLHSGDRRDPTAHTVTVGHFYDEEASGGSTYRA